MDEQFKVVEPPKESSPMWESKGKVYYQETGELASDADVAAFREKHRRLKEQDQKNVEKRKDEDREWKEKYIPLMREFWETGDGEDLYDYNTFGPADLVYNLSTTFFDEASPEGDSVPPGKDYMEYCRSEYDALVERIEKTKESDLTIEGLKLGDNWKGFKECLEKAKRIFPDYWKEALIGFGNGQHDT